MARAAQISCITIAFCTMLLVGCGSASHPWSSSPAGDTGSRDSAEADTGRADLVRPDLFSPSDVNNRDFTDIIPDTLPDTRDLIPELKPEVECEPDCLDKECGDDGCGGSCGACPSSRPLCSFGFQCLACEPLCDERECGSDGCGGLCGECPSGWTCDGGTCLGPQCQVNHTAWLERFDDCALGDLIVSDEQPQDGVDWAPVTTRFLSPPCALYLGDPARSTYDTGDRVSLSLTVPGLEVPGDGDPYALSFNLMMEADPVVAPQYPYDFDVLFLRAFGPDLPEGGLELFNSKELLNDTNLFWVPVTVDLSEFGGMTLELQFRFDTLDSVANDYLGVYLDDLKLATACPACRFGDDCQDWDPCTEDLCGLFSGGRDSGVCASLPKPLCCLDFTPEFCDDWDPCTQDSCDSLTGDCVHEPLNTPSCATNPD